MHHFLEMAFLLTRQYANFLYFLRPQKIEKNLLAPWGVYKNSYNFATVQTPSKQSI